MTAGFGEWKGIRGAFRTRNGETSHPSPLQKHVGERGWHGLRKEGARRTAGRLGEARQTSEEWPGELGGQGRVLHELHE